MNKTAPLDERITRAVRQLQRDAQPCWCVLSNMQGYPTSSWKPVYFVPTGHRRWSNFNKVCWTVHGNPPPKLLVSATTDGKFKVFQFKLRLCEWKGPGDPDSYELIVAPGVLSMPLDPRAL